MGKTPIFQVPIIWESCVIQWKGTKIACKVHGYRDPQRPRSAFLADCPGEIALHESDKKWLANFLAHVPPDITWGQVQVPGNPHQPTPTTDGATTTNDTSRWN